MRELLILAIHLLVTFARLLCPGGVRAVAAESLILKYQLIISTRPDNARRISPQSIALRSLPEASVLHKTDIVPGAERGVLIGGVGGCWAEFSLFFSLPAASPCRSALF